MPPPKPHLNALTNIDDNTSDDNENDNEYQYEWVRRGADTDTLNTGQTNSTYANSHINSNNNNNNAPSAETSQPTAASTSLKVSPTGSLNSNNDTFKKIKSSKYKNIKIHSPFVPLLLRTESLEEKVLREQAELQHKNQLEQVNRMPTIEQQNESDADVNEKSPGPANDLSSSSILNANEVNLEFGKIGGSASSSSDSIKSKKLDSPVSYRSDQEASGSGEGLVNLHFTDENHNSQDNKSFVNDSWEVKKTNS